MPRAIWTGTIGFGLVQIPVSLFAGEDKEELDMTLLDKRDFSPVGYQRINKVTGKEVPWSEIVKGYEHSTGEYVVLTDADFKAANVEASRSMDVQDFVDFSTIDPRLFDRPYYLAPQKAGRKAYALLRETLRKTGKAGIGKIVIRTRQHLAAVVARDKALVLVLLRFLDELRKEDDLDLPETNLSKLGVSPKEVAMAEQLVASMAGKFEAEQYVDEYRRDLMKLIQRKVKAGELNQVRKPEGETPERPRATNVIDLASLLAKSLTSGKPTETKAAANAKNGSATKRKHAATPKPGGKKTRPERPHRKSA
ncbi:MAG TPA: Ku protein [Polyangiaceae bacterium]|nr:Ku protein [Polyangiaceae bacterium]